MEIMVPVTVLVGVIGLLNLLLTFGVVRRLRSHEERLTASDRGAPVDNLPVGAQVGDFVVTTVDGQTLTPATFTGHTLVGFFAEGCEPCEDLVPRFIESISGTSPHPRVLAVVRGEVDGTFARRLSAVGSVVAGPEVHPIAEAFRVNSYPTMLLVGADGRVEATRVDLNRLPDLTAA